MSTTGKLTDLQKKKIIKDYVECGNYSAVARRFKVSVQTIKRVVAGDESTVEKVKLKKAENTAAVLAHMDLKKKDVCTLIDTLLEAINDPAKIMATPLSQLATTMGILIDKFTANEAIGPQGPRDNNLFEAIEQAGKGDLNVDELPELQHAPGADPDVVEPA